MKAIHSLGQALSASVEKVLTPLLLQTPSKALSMWLLKAFLESQKTVYSSLVACLLPNSEPQLLKPLQVLQAALCHLEEIESLLKEKSRLKSRKTASPETSEQILRLSRRILDCLRTDSQHHVTSSTTKKPSGMDTLADVLSRNTAFEDGTETLDSEQNKAAFRHHMMKIDTQLTNIHSKKSAHQSPSFKDDFSSQAPFLSSPEQKPQPELTSSKLQGRNADQSIGFFPTMSFAPAKDLTFHFQSQITTHTPTIPKISLFNDSPLREAESSETDGGLFRRFKICFLLDFIATSRLRPLFFETRRTKKRRIELLESELARERVVNFRLLEALKNIGLSTDQVISQTFRAKGKQGLQFASKLPSDFSRPIATAAFGKEVAHNLLHSLSEREALRCDPEIKELSFQEALPHDRRDGLKSGFISNRDPQQDTAPGRLLDFGIQKPLSARNMEDHSRCYHPFLQTSEDKKSSMSGVVSLRRLQEVSNHFPNSARMWAGRLELPSSSGRPQQKSSAIHKLRLVESEVELSNLDPASRSPKFVAKKPSAAADPQKPTLSASSSKTQINENPPDKNSLFLQKKIKKSNTLGAKSKRYFASSIQNTAHSNKGRDRKGQMSLTHLQKFFDNKKLSEDGLKVPRPA